ncbi:MAG: TlpA disulfide reductase family protein [Pseudomonadota bacterium]
MNHSYPGTRVALIALLALVLQACSEDEAPAASPADADSAALLWTGTELLGGETVEFPAVLGEKPAVMVFWATWCPYCKAFMPYTREIQKDYADHGVQIITFNAKERGKGDPRAYIESLNFPMVTIADADPIAEQYGVDFIPGLMVVDGQGEVVYRRGWTELPAGQKVAQQWDSEVRSALDETLGLGSTSAP